MNGNTFFWTAATVLASSWVAVELLKRQSAKSADVEEIGESDEQLEQMQRPVEQQAIDVQQELERRQRQQIEEARQFQGNQQQNNEDAPRDIGAEWDNDDRARRALEEHQARQAQDDHRVNAWKQKGIVGTKKAKSLERRDRRRAYYEYVRQEADRERERIKIEEEMFGDLVAEEREEREKRIEQAQFKLDESNRKRREREEEERNQRNKRREEIKADIQSKGFTSLKDDLDIEIADELSNVLVLESGDYAVSLTQKVVDSLSTALRTQGRLSFEEIQQQLTSLY